MPCCFSSARTSGRRPRNSTNASSGSRLPPRARIESRKRLRGGVIEHAGLLEGRESIGREHFGPLVAVVTRGVTAREDVPEAVREAIPLRHGHHGHFAPHFARGSPRRGRPCAGSYSACMRKSNSANSSCRIVCSPAWKLRVAMSCDCIVRRQRRAGVARASRCAAAHPDATRSSRGTGWAAPPHPTPRR